MNMDKQEREKKYEEMLKNDKTEKLEYLLSSFKPQYYIQINKKKEQIIFNILLNPSAEDQVKSFIKSIEIKDDYYLCIIEGEKPNYIKNLGKNKDNFQILESTIEFGKFKIEVEIPMNAFKNKIENFEIKSELIPKTGIVQVVFQKYSPPCSTLTKIE